MEFQAWMTSTVLSFNFFFYYSRRLKTTLISSFIFIDLLHSVPDNFFLFRAFKDFQGCQESQERGARGWVSSLSVILFLFTFAQVIFLPLPLFNPPLCCRRVPNDASVLSTPLSLPIDRRPLSVLIKHSVTSWNCAALFSQTFVYFGSGFGQAVLLCCQGPLVKLESKQA